MFMIGIHFIAVKEVKGICIFVLSKLLFILFLLNVCKIIYICPSMDKKVWKFIIDYGLFNVT